MERRKIKMREINRNETGNGKGENRMLVTEKRKR